MITHKNVKYIPDNGYSVPLGKITDQLDMDKFIDSFSPHVYVFGEYGSPKLPERLDQTDIVARYCSNSDPDRIAIKINEVVKHGDNYILNFSPTMNKVPLFNLLNTFGFHLIPRALKPITPKQGKYHLITFDIVPADISTLEFLRE